MIRIGIYISIMGIHCWVKKIGIVGFGKIWEAVAKRCTGFRMEIYYHDLFPKADIDIDAKTLPFERIILDMNYITLHVPYSKDTHHLIDKTELKNMKKSAYLINASRGAVVNQEALIDALRNKDIAGAALDVYETEPAVPKELTKLNNVLLTPHIGSATIETRIAMTKQSADKIIQTLEGNIPDDLVNRKEIGVD